MDKFMKTLIVLLSFSLTSWSNVQAGPGKGSGDPNKIGSGETETEEEKFTESVTGCSCWFDPLGCHVEVNGCACCKNNGVQCGYPEHDKCQTPKRAMVGCKGIKNPSATLSEKGHFCHFDTSRTDCAWCAHDGYQCANYDDLPSNEGNFCKSYKLNHKECFGCPQDCRNNPDICDPNATCTSSGLEARGSRQGYTWVRHSCYCNEGYTGNGIVCINDSTGVADRDVCNGGIGGGDGSGGGGGDGGDTERNVQVTLKLTTDFNLADCDNPEVVYDEDTNDFFAELENMLDVGQTCDGCSADVIFCNGSD